MSLNEEEMDEQHGIEELLQKEVRDAILSEIARFRAQMNERFADLEGEVRDMFEAALAAERMDE